MVVDDAIGDDVVGDDYDGGQNALNWRTCNYLAVWVHVPLFLLNNFKSPPKFAKIYIYQYWISSCLWILCQIICNRLVARLTRIQPRLGAKVLGTSVLEY